VGSYVPASSAKLHVFDSVQTRMGASDSLQKGSSTFFEELSETSTILSTATCRSLVILDELGRGTSTHDGVAIAYATLHYLVKQTKCLTLFVTHYPKIAQLKDEFPGEVNPYFVSYMAQECGASNETAQDPMEVVDETSEDSERITFLYKLVPGVASKSFGLHVARLAQVRPHSVIYLELS
jgi:DNA mismatch repair protein MSH3